MEHRQPTTPDAVRVAGHPVASFDAASLSALMRGTLPPLLTARLGEYIHTRRWFRGKTRTIRAIEVLDQLPLRAAPDDVIVLLIRVSYTVEGAEVYVLPLAQSIEANRADTQPLVFVLQPAGAAPVVVYDPTDSDDFSQLLLDMAVRTRTPGELGTILAQPVEALVVRAAGPRPAPRHMAGEQSNTTVFFGHEFMLKLFRQIEPGENPDVELNEFLWARGYRNVPEPLGSVRYEGPALAATLGIVQRFVPSDGTAWDATLTIVERSLERATQLSSLPALSLPGGDLLGSPRPADPVTAQSVEPYSMFATRLGERTAELHLALASDTSQTSFAPEPFSAGFLRSTVQAACARAEHAFDLLHRQLAGLPAETQRLAEEVFACRAGLTDELRAFESMQVRASRIRCHGDYHLGQVLYGSGDFTILDFEGEPAQPIEIRRRKGSALYDVSGMLRSFHYASTVARRSERWQRQDDARLAAWSEAWYRWAGAAFLSAYVARARAGSAVFLPDSAGELRALLRLHLIDKCCYELSYELNNRPAWVGVPMAGLCSIARSR